MSRQKVTVVALLVALAVGAVVFLATRPNGGSRAPEPSAGASLGGGEAEPKAVLWARIAKLGAWLPTFESALMDPEPEAKTVLAAFATLAEKVGGPSGFWRDQVPNEILSCHREPEQAVCKRLQEALPELTDGESLARSIGRLDGSRAELFLERNAGEMLQWVQTFAPSEPSATAMKQTTFWEAKLGPAVAGQ